MPCTKSVLMLFAARFSACGIADAIQNRAPSPGFATPGSSGTISAGLTDTHGGSDFDAGTQQGTSGNLTVNGTFSRSDLNGSVSYMGTGGNLDGLIGVTQAVGAFHSNNFSSIFAGGFIVD